MEDQKRKKPTKKLRFRLSPEERRGLGLGPVLVKKVALSMLIESDQK